MIRGVLSPLERDACVASKLTWMPTRQLKQPSSLKWLTSRATFLMKNFRPQRCQALTCKWPPTSSLCVHTEWVHCAKSEAGVPPLSINPVVVPQHWPCSIFPAIQQAPEFRDCVIHVPVHLHIQQIQVLPHTSYSQRCWGFSCCTNWMWFFTFIKWSHE